MKAEKIIKQLELKPHPEGGFYKEIYKSQDFAEPNCLQNKFNSKRRFSTSIYYLLRDGDFSAFHRIRSDELWHYYAGADIMLHLLDHKNGHQTKILGNEITGNGSFQDHFGKCVVCCGVFAAWFLFTSWLYSFSRF